MRCINERLDEKSSNGLAFFSFANGASPSWRRKLVFTGHDSVGIGMTAGLRGTVLLPGRKPRTTGWAGRRVAWLSVERRRRRRWPGGMSWEAKGKEKGWTTERNERMRRDGRKRSGGNSQGQEEGTGKSVGAERSNKGTTPRQRGCNEQKLRARAPCHCALPFVGPTDHTTETSRSNKT